MGKHPRLFCRESARIHGFLIEKQKMKRNEETNMKKILALTLALVFALGPCACGGQTEAPAEET